MISDNMFQRKHFNDKLLATKSAFSNCHWQENDKDNHNTFIRGKSICESIRKLNKKIFMVMAHSPAVVILGYSSLYEKYFPGQKSLKHILNETNLIIIANTSIFFTKFHTLLYLLYIY